MALNFSEFEIIILFYFDFHCRQLVIKGVLYESCVGYCQAKATGSPECSQQEMTFSRLLDGSVGFSDSDLSLLSWLQSIPSETFSVPFEQKTLNVDVERLERPSLETSWTEHMLITPIKVNRNNLNSKQKYILHLLKKKKLKKKENERFLFLQKI